MWNCAPSSVQARDAPAQEDPWPRGEMFVSVPTLRTVLQRRGRGDQHHLGRPGRRPRPLRDAAFLLGSAPYTSTLAKLRAWYARTEEAPTMTAERTRVAVASLVQAIPPEHHEEG